MNRKLLIRSSTFVVAVVMTLFATVQQAVCQAKKTSTKPDIVAVMGGTPSAMLERMFTEMGGIEQFVKKGMKVVIKPNIGWDKTPEMAANTNPELVGAMVRKCFKAGASEVLVFDHTCNNWINCYKNSGIKQAVEAAGGKMISGADENLYVDVALPKGVVLKSAKIHKSLEDCDVWFNMPILKHHGGAKLTVSMKNYMGIVWDRKIFHSTDLQQCIADINTYAKRPALHIVDCYRILVQNGPQGKTADDVVMLKSLIASPDPVAADAAALKLFNQARPVDLKNVSHIGNAEKLGLGTTNLEKLNIKRIKL